MKYCGNCRLQLQDFVTTCPRCGMPQAQRRPAQQYPPGPQGYGQRPPPRAGQTQYSQRPPPQRAAPAGYQQRPPPASYPKQRQPPPQARPIPQPQQQARPVSAFCGKCGTTLRHIAEYDSYYCDRCMEYKSGPGPGLHRPEPQPQPRPQPQPQPQPAAPRHTPPPTPPPAPVVEKQETPVSADEAAPSTEFDIRSITTEEDETKLNAKISSALNSIKNIISEKRDEGHDVSELTELYRQCGNVYASDDFYTAVHYLERIQDYLDTIPEVIPEFDEDELTDEHVDIFELDEIDFIDEDEQVMGFDDSVVVLEDRPDKGFDHFELEDKPKMGDKEKAIQALESAKSAIIDADEDGYDTTVPKQLFREARPLYETSDFKAVVDKVREVESEILRIKGHSEKEIEELLGELPDEEPVVAEKEKKEITSAERAVLKEMINKTWARFKEAEKYGIDTGGYKVALEMAKSKRVFKDARAIVESVTQEIKDRLSAYHTQQHEKASNRFHYVRSEILNASRVGIDVSPYQNMLDRASSSISRSDYDDAMFTMDRCLGELKKATDSVTAQAQAQAGAVVDEGVIKVQAVWDPDEDDADKPAEMDAKKDQKDLTDEERLKILEDRFILGEISEESYRELKGKLLQRLGRLS